MLSNVTRLARVTSLAHRAISNTVVLRSAAGDNVNLPYLEIPVYPVDKPQTLKMRKSRLVYQSRKRGMLENDLLLSTFAKKYLDGFTEEQTLQYDRLINSPSNDWDIFYWMIGKKPTPKEFDNEIMDLLKVHVKNEDKVARIQPAL